MRRPSATRSQLSKLPWQLIRAHVPRLVARYEDEFAKRLGKFRLERITKAVERLR
jgi:hypothetical protein